jgi:hypothetical protein
MIVFCKMQVMPGKSLEFFLSFLYFVFLCDRSL